MALHLPEQLRPFRSRSFRIYWSGQAISFTGTWMQQMALGWIVTRLSQSASVLGIIAIANAAPMALLGFQAGALADRHSRRNILIVTQLVMALLAVAMAFLASTGVVRLGHVYAFSLCLGLTTAYDMPAAQAFSPELVPPEDIPRAVALMQAIFHASRLVGPALAGVAIEKFGEASAFLANGVSFLAVILSLLAIPAAVPGGGSPGRGGPGRGGGSPGRGGIGEGIRYVRSEPVLAPLFGLLLLCMLLAFPFLVSLMSYYARYVVVSGALGMGSIMSGSGLGAMAGSTFLVFTGTPGWRRRMGLGTGLIAAGLIGLGLVRQIHAAVALTALLSMGTSLYLGTTMQVVQHRVPNVLRGRTMSVFTVGMISVMPLAGFGLSLLADVVGLPRLMIVCGTLFGLVAGVLVARLRHVNEAVPA